MDKMTNYRNIVQKLIREYCNYDDPNVDVRSEAIMERDHFEVIHVGWRGQRRIHDCVLHIDLQDGKIWIQYDGIEGGVAERLVEAGVPKSDIVLAFHSPYKRKFTEYAVG